MKATILHNPRCSKSRETLALLHAAGAEVTVVDYQRDPPTRDALAAMLARGGIAPQAALRGDAPPVADDAGALDLIAGEPRWLERPFVETAAGVRLCRPPALVHEILP